MLPLPDTSSPSIRIVLVKKDGTHQICGLAPVCVAELCAKASFIEADPQIFGVPASLVKVAPRYVLYRELMVPTDLKSFDPAQR